MESQDQPENARRAQNSESAGSGYVLDAGISYEMNHLHPCVSILPEDMSTKKICLTSTVTLTFDFEVVKVNHLLYYIMISNREYKLCTVHLFWVLLDIKWGPFKNKTKSLRLFGSSHVQVNHCTASVPQWIDESKFLRRSSLICVCGIYRELSDAEPYMWYN